MTRIRQLTDFLCFCSALAGSTKSRNLGRRQPSPGFLAGFKENEDFTIRPWLIHRAERDDHGVSYQAILSGRGLYGALPGAKSSPDTFILPSSLPVDLNAIYIDQKIFRQAIGALFRRIRDSQDYDYVLVDTRGGFAFESTDVCAVADSFIVITEANYTAFYQDRNLVDRIAKAGRELGQKPLLRAIIVNKATGGEEKFRAAIRNEFGIRMEDTYSVTLDLEAIRIYKSQQIIYRRAPASPFAFDTLRAFADILRIVTCQWPEERVRRWNEIVEEVKSEIAKRNRFKEEQESQDKEKARLLPNLQAENQQLQTTLRATREILDQTRRDSNQLVETIRLQHAQTQEALERERSAAEQRAKERDEELRGRLRLSEDVQRNLRRRVLLVSMLLLLALVAAIFSQWEYLRTANHAVRAQSEGFKRKTKRLKRKRRRN